MKIISIAGAGLSIALIALTLVSQNAQDRLIFAIGALIFSVITFVMTLIGWPQSALRSVRPNSEPPVSTNPPAASVNFPSASVSAPAVTTAPSKEVRVSPKIGGGTTVVSSQADARSSEAEVVGFLAMFQEKGRLVDFLQDDITGYSDAQVGAAARVVHQGCKAVLNEYFRIVPVREENEGARITISDEYVAAEYRLVGKISGTAPFSGTLVHRGWKAKSVILPRLLQPLDDRLPTIAPAEVELR